MLAVHSAAGGITVPGATLQLIHNVVLDRLERHVGAIAAAASSGRCRGR